MKALIKGFVAFVAAALAFVQPASAAYNANISGVVLWVAAYMDADYIYFQLNNQPTTHPGCNPSYFVITQDIPQNRRNQAFALLLAAKQSGEPLNIGFDNAGECAGGYIRVHRVG